MILVVSKEKTDTKSESDENSLISPNEIVSNKAQNVDINVLPEQQHADQGEEVKKDSDHQNPDTINQTQELQCNHSQSSDQTDRTLDCQNQELSSQTQSDQQTLDQNLQTSQDQNKVVDQLHDTLASTDEVQTKQLTSELQQTTQSSPEQSSQQSEPVKEQEQQSSSSTTTTTTVTTPSEPQTPSKIKAICNAPVPIGWPKVN